MLCWFLENLFWLKSKLKIEKFNCTILLRSYSENEPVKYIINPWEKNLFHSKRILLFVRFQNQYLISMPFTTYIYSYIYSIKIIIYIYPFNSFNQINLKQEHINPSDINILQELSLTRLPIKMIKLQNENRNQFTENSLISRFTRDIPKSPRFV